MTPRTLLFIDTETTGLTRADELIELAAVLVEVQSDGSSERPTLGRELDAYEGLREPACPIGSSAYAVHGISYAEVRGHSLDDARIGLLLAAADGVVAHSAAFDRRFVADLFPEAATARWYCSARGIDWRRRGFADGRLQTLLRTSRISTGRAHRALADVRGVIELLRHHDALDELLTPPAPRRRSVPAATARAEATRARPW